MDTNKLSTVEFLFKDEVACCYENIVACWDEGLVKCMCKINKDYFDVDFLLAHPLEYLLEETLCVHQSYMNKIVWSDTYFHFCLDHTYKTPMVYQDRLNGGRDKGWPETYIHFFRHHQQFLQYFERKSILSIETYLKVLHHHP